MAAISPFKMKLPVIFTSAGSITPKRNPCERIQALPDIVGRLFYFAPHDANGAREPISFRTEQTTWKYFRDHLSINALTEKFE